MIYIFDLDYMLLDTSRQRNKIAGTIGLSVEEYQKSYFRHYTSRKKHYNPYQHIDILHKEGRFGADKREDYIKNIDKLVIDLSNSTRVVGK